MRAKLVNEAIKHLEPRSEKELLKHYSALDPGEKLITGFKNGLEELVKLAIKEEPRYKELGEAYLENREYSVEMDTTVDLDKKGNMVRNEESDYFVEFVKDHNLSYKVVTLRGPGGGFPILEYTGKFRDIVDLLLGPFDTGLEGEEAIEELEMYLDWEHRQFYFK